MTCRSPTAALEGWAQGAGAAEEDELYVEPADFSDGMEHLGLKRERHVPGGLPAHGGVHGEHEPAAAGGRRGPK